MTKTPEPTSKPPPAVDEEITAMLDIIERNTSGLIDD